MDECFSIFLVARLLIQSKSFYKPFIFFGMDLSVTRELLQKRLQVLTEEEDRINQELQSHFAQLIGKPANTPSNSNNTKATVSTGNNPALYEGFNLLNDLQKVKNFGPVYESVEQNAKKLSTQIEECNALSERLSQIVRKLDLKQARAQKALATTEDILNLKDCKHKILQAIEGKDLSAAVNCLRQVHEINEKAAKTSEDYEIIAEKEKEVKEMVRNEFQTAITESNTNAVMSLCPLLQTLGLEAEARDNFLTYMESKVFIAVSADAASVDGATDPSTAYAQALSNVFNSTCLIIQQYLPMVIQGLENSLGDVYFIRRLHKRCEQEAGLVLKRYMKYRGVKEIIHHLSQVTANSPQPPLGTTTRTVNPGEGGSGGMTTPAEMHTIMNELALLIQYCCKYLKYLRNVCQGAENKIRISSSSSSSSSSSLANPSSSTLPTTANNTITTTAPIIVFSGPLEFDKMIDELINKYYMEGEQWLMRMGIINVLPKNLDLSSYHHLNHNSNDGKMSKLDECFFVLQKCGLRSIASHNIHAACACLTFISDLISNDLLNQGMEMLLSAMNKLSSIIQEYIQRYRKRMVMSGGSGGGTGGGGSGVGDDSNFISKGFSSAMSLASTIAGGSTAPTDTATASSGSNTEEIVFHEDGTFTIPSLLPINSGFHSTDDDRWGVATYLEAFNIMELCIRYTERLNKDLYIASQNVFMTDEDELAEQQMHAMSLASTSGTIKYSSGGQKYNKPSSTSNATTKEKNRATTEFDRIKLCKENFDNIKITYSNVSPTSFD